MRTASQNSQTFEAKILAGFEKDWQESMVQRQNRLRTRGRIGTKSPEGRSTNHKPGSKARVRAKIISPIQGNSRRLKP